MGNFACSTALRHGGKSSEAKENSANTSTGFRRRGQGGAQAKQLSTAFCSPIVGGAQSRGELSLFEPLSG